MNAKDAEINRLVVENNRLKAGKVATSCKTCRYLKRHDCWTLFECPYLGIVDPDGVGCQRYKGGNGNGQK